MTQPSPCYPGIPLEAAEIISRLLQWRLPPRARSHQRKSTDLPHAFFSTLTLVTVTMILLRFILLVSSLTALSFAAAPAGLRAGAHAEDITPRTLPSPVNGSMKGSFANAVTDPMHARALALHDGKNELILCVVDACLIPREICESAKAIVAKQTGIPASHLLISATHSHSCAAMTPAFQSDPDPAYLSTLPARIAQALIRAHANLEPAEIAWGKDSDPTQVFNRRWHVQPGQTYENPFDRYWSTDSCTNVVDW